MSISKYLNIWMENHHSISNHGCGLCGSLPAVISNRILSTSASAASSISSSSSIPSSVSSSISSMIPACGTSVGLKDIGQINHAHKVQSVYFIYLKSTLTLENSFWFMSLTFIISFESSLIVAWISGILTRLCMAFMTSVLFCKAPATLNTAVRRHKCY